MSEEKSIEIPEIGNAFFRTAMGDIPAENRKLTLEQWAPTPFMVDVFVDHGENEERLMEWLRIHLGPASSPMHGQEGLWRRSQVTIHGYSWMGFKTEDLMKQFSSVFFHRIKI